MNRFGINLYTSSLLFSLLFIPSLLVSQTPNTLNSLIAIIASSFQLYIWNKSSEFDYLDKRSFIQLGIIFSVLILPFTILFNHSIIRLLWDTYIDSNGVHPYLVTPNDPLIGKSQLNNLFPLLKDNQVFSTVSHALLVSLKPIYTLYGFIGLFKTLLFSKILLCFIWLFTIWKTQSRMDLNIWMFNPFIWVFGLAQADFELIGMISLLWGYFYFQKGEFQNSYLIWGLSITFGLNYFVLILFILFYQKHLKYGYYLVLTALVWLILGLNTLAYDNFLFLSGWITAIPYHLINYISITDIRLISSACMVLLLISVLLIYHLKVDYYKKINLLLLACLLLLPLSFKSLWFVLGAQVFMLDQSNTTYKHLQLIFSLLIVFSIYFIA